MGVGFADHIALDLHVHHDEVCTIERIGHDTAYEGCSQNHCIRTLFVEEPLYSHLVCEVQFLMTTAYKISVPPLKEVIPNIGTNNNVVSLYIYLTVLV